MRDNWVFYNVKEDEKFTEEEKVDTESVILKTRLRFRAKIS